MVGHGDKTGACGGSVVDVKLRRRQIELGLGEWFGFLPCVEGFGLKMSGLTAGDSGRTHAQAAKPKVLRSGDV